MCFGARILEVTGAGVTLDGGLSVSADLVIVGIGAVPETGLAAAAGLAIENGIAVDDRLATSDPAIFAAGDCAAFLHPGYGGASGWSPGAAPRSKGRWRRGTCSVPASRSRRCPGSGPTSTT